jgi:NADH:ubiquinone oxidoreductase subunit 5 (subunit L)/multisubunit Na+/H+ antiporter MnhA subunit
MALFVMPTRALGWLSAMFDRRVIDAVVNFFGFFGVLWAFIVDVADRLIVDGLFVNGSARATSYFGDQLSYAQTGRVRQYLVYSVAGIVAISAIILLVFYHM